MTVLKAYIHLFVQQILKTSSRFWLSKCYLGCGIFLEFLLCFTPRNFRRMSPLTPPPPLPIFSGISIRFSVFFQILSRNMLEKLHLGFLLNIFSRFFTVFGIFLGILYGISPRVILRIIFSGFHCFALRVSHGSSYCNLFKKLPRNFV